MSVKRKSGPGKRQKASRAAPRRDESVARYKLAMRAINEGVYDWDIARGTIYYSEGVYSVLKMPRSMKTVADWRRRIHPDDLPAFTAAVIGHLKGQTKRFQCDYRFRAADGSWRWARQHGIAQRDRKGRAVRMIGSSGDITELKRVEQALKDSEQRHALATRAATEGIYDWNVASGELYLSERAKEFFGVGAGRLTPKAWNRRIHPEDYPGYRQAVLACFKGLAPQVEHEYRIRNAAGGYAWVVDRGIAVRDEAGRATRLVGALSDVTQRKLNEIELRRARDEATEALEQKAAAAEVLKVIASSPSDVQPVFDAIVESAARLCGTPIATMFRYDGNLVDVAASTGWPGVEKVRRIYPRPPDRKTMAGRVLLGKAVVEVPDFATDPELSETVRTAGLEGGIRATLGVPMMQRGMALGAIVLSKHSPGRFDPKQVALLQTFADQAVIAIENVRLFNELKQRTEALAKSVGQLQALGEVGQAISSTLDLETVLKTIVARAVQLTGMDGGTIYEFDEPGREFHLRAAENMPEELAEVYRRMPIRLGEGIVGGAAVKREPMQVPDIQDPSYQTRYRELLLRHGYRAILAVPLLRDEQIIGALTVNRNRPGAFTPETVELLKTFATQSAMAIQNARLFREIADKGKQLEVASQHKSQFLASMSHELRTPLNAILGFNEMILGDVYGEVPADMRPALEQTQTSGKHLLRLINNVLDLAKIEAGRMELALSDYSVQDTVESVRSTLRPLAAEKGLEFLASVPQDLPLAYGDSGRITQCLMNLAGNSLKFTKQGKVEIAVEQKDGLLTYRVTDTGIGIPPEKIGSLFTEFKQTDATIASEYGGTGLGLSITRKFIEMHGGRIWVESEPGKGSSFIFELPLRVQGE